MKLDSGKILTVAIAALGLVGTVLNNKKEESNMKRLKEDLKKEIIEDLANEK